MSKLKLFESVDSLAAAFDGVVIGALHYRDLCHGCGEQPYIWCDSHGFCVCTACGADA
ncbi:MAG: hypothetical protein DDT26_00822 [Dehalococcoidia bacterium]|nr:hypothetical protein [Chloroflexota bacterium]